MKKILILCQYFYPEYVSSATLPTQLAEDLIANHINVDVMCGWPYEYSNHRDIFKTEMHRGIRIRRLKSKVGRIIKFIFKIRD